MTARVLHVLAICLTAWGVNFLIRAFPFLLFGRPGATPPAFIHRLDRITAPVVIAGLIVYSYSDLAWQTWLPYAAGGLTVLLQLAFRNPLVSIVAGTVLYMWLVR